MNIKKLICIVLLLLGVAGAIASVVMLISAIAFMEWGRVLLYSMVGAFCTELAIWSALQLRKRKEQQ